MGPMKRDPRSTATFIKRATGSPEEGGEVRRRKQSAHMLESILKKANGAASGRMAAPVHLASGGTPGLEPLRLDPLQLGAINPNAYQYYIDETGALKARPLGSVPATIEPAKDQESSSGGDSTAPAGSPTTGQGVSNTAQSIALGLMGYGQLGFAPGAIAASVIGNAIADSQLNAMANVASALSNAAPVSETGIATVSDQDGNVSTVSNDASIAAQDASVTADADAAAATAAADADGGAAGDAGEFARGGEVLKFIKRATGSPKEGEVAQQMTVGTPMTPQERAQPSASREAFEAFKATAPAMMGMIPQAATTVAGNIVQGITDPKAHAKRSLENIAKQLKENPEEFVMNWTGGGLGGVLKPKGGIFPKAGTGSGIDNFLQRVEEQVGREAQDLTVGQIKTLNQFINDKGRKYLTTTYGTGSDPLRDALLEGRLPAFGTDAKNFRDYMLQAAREGNPRALEDFETMYDTRSGIEQFVAVPSRDQYDLAAKIRDKATQDMLDKIAKEGVDLEQITVPILQRIDTESMLKNYSPEYQKNLARRLLGEQFPEAAKDPNSRMYLQPEEMADETLIRAAREGEVFYDIPASPSLDFLDPKNLAKSLATLNPDKLGNMSFAEAVVQGTKNTKLQRDWDEVIKKVEGNKSVPKESFDVGTETFRPMGQDKWVRLLTPQAVQLEGAAMHHSIGGYAKKGNYGEGGKEALESGRAQIFSLRGPDNLPRVTVEARKNDDGTLFVKQIKGNFNGVPDPADQEIIVQFLKDLPIDKIQPERYIKTKTGEELEEAVRIDWSERAGFGARSIF